MFPCWPARPCLIRRVETNLVSWKRQRLEEADGPTLELIHTPLMCDGITFTAKLDWVQQKLEGLLQKKWASKPDSLP